MDMKNQQKYVEEVAEIITTKILSMKNINKSIIDVNKIKLLAYKAASDLLQIGFICNREYGLFDEFTGEQLSNNCKVGELQIFFDEFIGTKINITRFKDDLSDLDIRLVNNTDDYLIVVIESNLDKVIQIKNPEKELRFQDGKLKVLDHTGMYEFIDIKDIDLEEAVKIFNYDINTHRSDNLLEDKKGNLKK